MSLNRRLAFVFLLGATWLAFTPMQALGATPDALADKATLAPARHLRQAYARPPAQWPPPWIDDGVAFVELASPPPRPLPAATDRLKAEIGAKLFFDKRLSVDGSLSCASCHRPDQGWSVSTAVALGHAGQPGKRNPPSLHAVASHSQWGWDGRGTSLPARSLLPLTDPREMANTTLDAVWARVLSDPDYASALREMDGNALTSPQLLGELLAAFQKNLDRPTRFDRFLQGDTTRLNDQEIQGLHLFRTKARCANCHFGPLLTDEKFHNLGISFFGERSQDLGRYAATGRCEDVGRFRTASLRHISHTAPYMHNGLFDSLSGVVHLYARGGGEVRARNATEAAHPLYACAASLSKHIQPLRLTPSEVAALLSFLKAL